MHQSDEGMSWSRRYQANLEKLGSRDLAKVAEVVSDLEVRERGAGLSAGEKRMLGKARHMRSELSGRVEPMPTRRPINGGLQRRERASSAEARIRATFVP